MHVVWLSLSNIELAAWKARIYRITGNLLYKGEGTPIRNRIENPELDKVALHLCKRDN